MLNFLTFNDRCVCSLVSHRTNSCSTWNNSLIYTAKPIGMSDGARRRLQLFANNFENKMKGNPNAATPGRGLQQATGAAAERRGLLDDDDDYGDDMIEFETRKSR